MGKESFSQLHQNILNCRQCANVLPLEPKPILQIHPDAKVLIAGQAPGQKAHDAGRPFDDASGDRLRQWLGLNKSDFYDPTQLAIVPMGFCFPGNTFFKSGPSKGRKSGDLPPRPECAATWHEILLGELNKIELTIVLGSHAQAYYLNQSDKVTEQVKRWAYWLEQGQIALPHPSPRNNRWLKQNPWFEEEVLPILRDKVKHLLR
ncbi:uracil-DNA glycosylase family protein [Marinomonas gallaica]|uniref:uracil-DNA glycosylase family protein n=1 Tax=Marinomonas gallaica TaxID=1806667 RepID=UPI003A9306B5